MDGGNDQPFINLRFTDRILHQAYVSFNSNLAIFFFLSLFIISFHLVVQDGAHLITSLIHQDPSFKLLFSCLNHSASHQSPSRQPEEPPTTSHIHRSQHLRSFLRLTRAVIFDEDDLSDDSDDERSFYVSSKSQHNNSSIIYIGSMLPFSDEVVDDGVNVLEIVRPGIKFKAGIVSSLAQIYDSLDQGEENATLLGNDYQDLYSSMNKSSFVKDMGLSLRDLEGLFFLVTLLCVAHGGAILAFVLTYASVLGIVFVAVVDDFLGRFTPSVIMFGNGSKLGLKRLFGFVLLRWALRDALTHLLVLWFFYETGYENSFSKHFMSLKLIPFSILSPWLKGFAKEIPAFILLWVFLDFFVSFILAVHPWVFIVGSRRRGRSEFLEGWFVMRKMFLEAIQIITLEVVGCGSLVLVVGILFGRYAAIALQSLVEVYFMVAWLIFYFSAISIAANSRGRRFGQRELQFLIRRLT